jgi:hypothetical protein
MERYRVVRKEPIVNAILAALGTCDCRIVSPPDPRRAPFEVRILTPAGEALDLVCYAFLANEYRQRGRPADEHRFQVKYGSDFHRYHHLFVDQERARITLFLGVHLERGVFIGADPAMHDPTCFSSSVELRTHHLTAARRTTWTGWERDRSMARRKRAMPQESSATECLIAFTADRFLDYVLFERHATGIDAGERLRLAERVGRRGRHSSQHRRHPLEQELGLEAREILDLVGAGFRLHAALGGQAAELYLGRLLEATPGITHVRHLDEDSRPDFELRHEGRTRTIECKNSLRGVPKGGLARVDFQKSRASKADPCSRYYRASQFDVLAACLHPVTDDWTFRFRRTHEMEAHRRCPGRLSERVIVTDGDWSKDVLDVLRSR